MWHTPDFLWWVSGPPSDAMSTSSPVTLRTMSGPVTNTRPVRRHDDDVGQRGAVGGTARGEADDDRDLRDVTRRADHRLEDQADRVQRLDAFGQPGAAGVPDADDRALLLDGGVVGVDDVGAAFDTHGAAHDGAVGAERDGAHTVDGARGGEHAGAVALVQQFNAAVVVEERLQSQQRITWIE